MSETSGMCSQETWTVTPSAISSQASEDSPSVSSGPSGKDQSGPGVSLAKTSRLQAKVPAWKAREADSGGSGSVLFELVDPQGCSLRTSLLSGLEGLTKFSMHWNLSATPAGRSWWVLKLSERPTAGSESGSSDDWQTPSAGLADAGATSRSGDRKGELLLGGQVRAAANWPTPDASVANDGEGLETWLARREELKQTANNGNGCGTPLTMAVQMWPTPMGCERDQYPKQFRRGSVNLTGHPALTNRCTPGKPRGSLSPIWVSQLQGYPIGWIDEF